jgi:hypothetical protein
MKLSAESFRDLARAYSKERSRDHDRRRSQRVKVQTRVPLSLIDDGEARTPAPIMVLDVSPRGISVLYPQRLAPGTQFTVQLAGSLKTITLLCTVMHSRQISNGLYNVGAEFTCVVPAKDNRKPADGRAVNRIRNSILE